MKSESTSSGVETRKTRRQFLISGGNVLPVLALVGFAVASAVGASAADNQTGDVPPRGTVADGVSATASTGLVISLERTPPHGAGVLLKIENPSPYAWCFNTVSFSASQFQIKIGNRVISGKASKVDILGVPFLCFRPGEAREEKIDLHTAFTPDDLQKGILCYSFVYRRDPILPDGVKGPRGEIGTICEGRKSTGYLMPTE